MFKKLLKNSWLGIKYNPLHLGIGILMTWIGLDLFILKDFFFWPPAFISVLNDDAVGFLSILLGIGLIIYTLSNKPNVDINTILLSGSSGFLAMLGIIELGHAHFTNFYKMDVLGILALFASFVTIYTARHSDYIHRNKKK